ncbi:unnamed protein product, partial [Candidula unifasciata]
MDTYLKERHVKDTLRYSLKDTLTDVFKEAYNGSLTDTFRGSLKDTFSNSLTHNSSDHCTELSSNHKESKSEHTFDAKLQTTSNANSAVYFTTEHRFLETTSSLIQHRQPSHFKQETSLSPFTLALLGITANFLLIGPLVVAFWNSTWCFFDYILQDHDCQVSVWTSAAIGFPCMALVTFFQGSVLSYSSKCNTLARLILSRTYTYVLSVACVNQWRSTWLIADCYVGSSLFNSAVTFGSVFLVLLLSRCLVSACAPPVFIAMEVPHVEYYKVATFRGGTPTCSLEYLLDTLISVFGIQVLVIVYWRAFWEILDYCLMPEDPHLSAVYSVGIGVGLSCILFILQV